MTSFGRALIDQLKSKKGSEYYYWKGFVLHHRFGILCFTIAIRYAHVHHCATMWAWELVEICHKPSCDWQRKEDYLSVHDFSLTTIPINLCLKLLLWLGKRLQNHHLAFLLQQVRNNITLSHSFIVSKIRNGKNTNKIHTWFIQQSFCKFAPSHKLKIC